MEKKNATIRREAKGESAQAFLRLGLATTILTGGALLAAGELSFLYYLGFLFAAARLYDPLGLVLQNIAATFNTKLQVERMRSILEQPVQEGKKDFAPENYTITFDHVSFAYREGDGVLEDVSFTAKQGESSPPPASWLPGSGTSPAGRSPWGERTYPP